MDAARGSSPVQQMQTPAADGAPRFGAALEHAATDNRASASRKRPPGAADTNADVAGAPPKTPPFDTFSKFPELPLELQCQVAAHLPPWDLISFAHAAHSARNIVDSDPTLSERYKDAHRSLREFSRFPELPLELQSEIAKYLSPRDLIAFAHASHSARDIVDSDPKLSKRYVDDLHAFDDAYRLLEDLGDGALDFSNDRCATNLDILADKLLYFHSAEVAELSTAAKSLEQRWREETSDFDPNDSKSAERLAELADLVPYFGRTPEIVDHLLVKATKLARPSIFGRYGYQWRRLTPRQRDTVWAGIKDLHTKEPDPANRVPVLLPLGSNIGFMSHDQQRELAQQLNYLNPGLRRTVIDLAAIARAALPEDVHNMLFPHQPATDVA